MRPFVGRDQRVVVVLLLGINTQNVHIEERVHYKRTSMMTIDEQMYAGRPTPERLCRLGCDPVRFALPPLPTLPPARKRTGDGPFVHTGGILQGNGSQILL